jgi:hypothetical protein
MATLLIGDRVRLTERAAHSVNNGLSGTRRQTRVDWHAREGVVYRGNATAVLVKWDGRASLDQWPVQALEKVE